MGGLRTVSLPLSIIRGVPRRAWRLVKRRLPAANTALLVLGAGCVLVALIGTGLTVAQVSVPAALGGGPRLALGVFGVVLVALSLVVGVALQGPPPPTRGFLGAPPPMPSRFIARPEEMSQLLAALRPGRVAALHGMAGAGKTSLAAAAAHDKHTHRAFPDGVIWLAVDQEPDLVALQAVLARRLGDANPGFTTVGGGRDALSGLLADRTILIVLDNVWDRQSLDTFIGLGSSVLFTTRHVSLARDIDATGFEVAALSLEQSLALLARWTSRPVDQLPAVADEICLRVDNLALGVAMVGAMLAQPSRTWADLLSLLRSADLQQIKADFGAGYPHPNLLAAITVSIDNLPPDAREKYRQLAVFQGRGPFTRAAAEALWSPLPVSETGDLLALLEGRSLVSAEGPGRFSIHDLLAEVIAKQQRPEQIRTAHAQLLDGYRYRPSRWPDDGYFLQNLAWHLVQVGRTGELHRLLLNIDWMHTKLSALGVASLLADYTHDPQPVAVAIHSACQLSAGTLAGDPDQLPGQLVGRLLGHDNPEVRHFAASVSQEAAERNDRVRACGKAGWLCPLTPALTSAGGPQQYILLGHTEMVTAVAISPDGSTVASASHDGTVRVWRLSVGEHLRTLPGHKGEPATAVAFSPDGRYVISGGRGCARLWNLASGRLVRTFPSDRRGNWLQTVAVTITSDGRQVVSGDTAGRILVWDLASGRRLDVLHHDGGLRPIVITLDGQWVASMQQGGPEIRIWDVPTGHLRLIHPPVDGPLADLMVTPDGKSLITAHSDGRSDDTAVLVWDLLSGEQVLTLQGRSHAWKRGTAVAMAVTPDGQHLICGWDDGLIQVSELSGGGIVSSMQGHHGPVNAVAVTPDGRHIISAGSDQTVRVWDLTVANRSKALQGRHNGSVISLAVTTDGQRVISAGEDEDEAQVWDLLTGEQRSAVRPGRRCRVQMISPDGHLAAFSTGNDGFQIWDVDKGELIHTSAYSLYPPVAISPEGLVIFKYIPTVYRTDIAVWDLFDAKLRNVLNTHGHGVDTVAIISHDQLVASLGGKEALQIWNLTTGKSLRKLHGHNDDVTALAVGSRGNVLISGSKDHTVRAWSLPTGQTLSAFTAHQGPVRTVALSSDGRLAISGGDDNTLRVWNVSNGDELARWVGDHPVTACALAPRPPLTIAVGDSAGTTYTLQLRDVPSRPEAP